MKARTAHEKMLSTQIGQNTGLIVGKDKDGDLFSNREVIKIIIKNIKDEDYFIRRAKIMTKEIDDASELIEKSYARFNLSLDNLVSAEKTATENTKKVSGKIRDATQKLSDGLLRIEKLANFDRLEKYVVLLEGAETAISSLAELERSGKLDKIASAIR